MALLRAAINHGLTDRLLSLVKGKNYGTQCVVCIPDKSGSAPLTFGSGSCFLRQWLTTLVCMDKKSKKGHTI